MDFNSQSKIPLELYPLIIGHIDNKNALLSMLVLSKTIFADVERKLYRSIGFRHLKDDKHILFLESVLDPHRTHLSGLVCGYYYSAAPLGNTSDTLLGLIKRALATFTNLKELRFGVPDKDTFSSVLPLGNPPFQLELFQWIDSSAHRDIEVLHFLASQHSLKTLSLYNAGFELSQRSSLQNLQNLNDISGSVAALFPLLPRSVPIKRIHWILDIGQDLDHFPPLTSLRVLSFDGHVPRPPLSIIIERFRTIEVLGLPSLQVCCVMSPRN